MRVRWKQAYRPSGYGAALAGRPFSCSTYPRRCLGLIGIALSARFLVAKTYSTCTVKRTTLNNYFLKAKKAKFILIKPLKCRFFVVFGSFVFSQNIEILLINKFCHRKDNNLTKSKQIIWRFLTKSKEIICQKLTKSKEIMQNGEIFA